jgi:hypothetical protein
VNSREFNANKKTQDADACTLRLCLDFPCFPLGYSGRSLVAAVGIVVAWSSFRANWHRHRHTNRLLLWWIDKSIKLIKHAAQP